MFCVVDCLPEIKIFKYRNKGKFKLQINYSQVSIISKQNKQNQKRKVVVANHNFSFISSFFKFNFVQLVAILSKLGFNPEGSAIFVSNLGVLSHVYFVIILNIFDVDFSTTFL